MIREEMEWYNKLTKPVFAPSGKVFMPIWSVLYVMILAAVFLLLKDGAFMQKTLPIAFFIIQLGLNLMWMPIFFGMKKMGLALLVNILLLVSILGMIFSFYPFSKLAAYLLLPYFLWVCFAIYLNFEYWRLNRKRFR